MFNDDDVIFQHNLMCPKTMLRFARLSLLCRILLKSPPGLTEIVRAEGSANFAKGWISSVNGDLKWLASSGEFASCSNFDCSQWLEYIAEDCSSVLRRIRTYCKSPFANIVTRWADSDVLRVFASPMVCYICGHVSKSLQAHSVHLSSKHQIKCKFRRYVDGNTCQVCLVNFGTRERCLNHVRYRSNVCRINYVMRGPSLTNDEAIALDSKDHEANRVLYSQCKRRHQAGSPCLQSLGPFLPILVERPSMHHHLGVGHNRR
jgi:hypothetical protein